MYAKTELHFSNLSMVDDFGRVFFHNGRIFRAINNDKKELCIEFLNSNLFTELSEKGLIPKTFISDLKVEEYNLILEHERLVEILQHEWSFDMLKKAAQMVLKVNEICNKYGYHLKDAHTLNVLFRGTEPVWVDLGSIEKKKDIKIERWIAYNEYLGSFIIPMLFWSKGMVYITRKLLESNFYRMFTIPSQSIVQSGLLKLLTETADVFQFKFRDHLLYSGKDKISFLSKAAQKTQSLVKTLTGRKTVTFTYENSRENFNCLSDYLPFQYIDKLIDDIKPPQLPSEWQEYHSNFYSSSNSSYYSHRFERIIAIIKEKENKISTVLDLAGNQGYVCKLIGDNTTVSRIIMADYDANAVNSAYLTFAAERQSKVHTLLLNFIFTPDLKSTFSRLKSDLVLALAVTHHLVLTQKFSIKTIFERIENFSNKFVMIEFMPLGLWSAGNKNNPAPPEWYNEGWFAAEFEKYFNVIIREQLEENRILYFGSKKDNE